VPPPQIPPKKKPTNLFPEDPQVAEEGRCSKIANRAKCGEKGINFRPENQHQGGGKAGKD